MLAVELDEQPEVGPREIDAGYELAMRGQDRHLASRRREQRDGAYQLHHLGLEEALRRWCVRWPERQDPAHPRHPSPGAVSGALQLLQTDEAKAQGRLQSRLPGKIIELGGQVDEGLDPVSATDAIYLDHTLGGELTKAGAGSFAPGRPGDGEVDAAEFNPVEPEDGAGHPAAGDATGGQKHRPSAVEPARLLAPSP